MIYSKNKEIVAIYHGKRAISEVSRGLIVVWQAIRSCFSKGYWANEKGWINDESWKN